MAVITQIKFNGVINTAKAIEACRWVNFSRDTVCLMRGWDGSNTVQWTTSSPASTPNQTTPPATGPIVNKQLIAVL